MNCPFYGRYLFRGPAHASTPFLLLDQRGNQCAVITEALAPCHMEMNNLAVDWRDCPVVRDLRLEREP
jgi:hypothetical protein